MDMSKLPRLSQTETPRPAVAQDPAPVAATTPPPLIPTLGSVADAWISLGIGLLLLYLTPHTIGYVSSKLFHTKFEPFPDPTREFPATCDFLLFNDGTKIFYRQTANFWSDAVITAFAIVLLMDGLILFGAKRPGPVLFAFGVTVVATLANGFYLAKTMGNGIPIVSAFAVLFGVYIALSQWGQYKTLKSRRGLSAG